jgi:hypothetical protein
MLQRVRRNNSADVARMLMTCRTFQLWIELQVLSLLSFVSFSYQFNSVIGLFAPFITAISIIIFAKKRWFMPFIYVTIVTENLLLVYTKHRLFMILKLTRTAYKRQIIKFYIICKLTRIFFIFIIFFRIWLVALNDNFALGCAPGTDYSKIKLFQCILEGTDATMKEVLEPITFFLAYRIVQLSRFLLNYSDIVICFQSFKTIYYWFITS